MAWLNYHHLLYFWTVARAGTLAAASKELRLSQPTISTQIKQLEDSLGQKLFQKQGRRLALTDVGRTTYRYADDIFRLGREMQEAVTVNSNTKQVRFAVGVTDVIPKLVAERLLQPAFVALPELLLECIEGPLPQLLGQLALHELDVVLSDQPAPNDIKVKAFNHALGESGTSFFARGAQAHALKANFPAALDQTPMLVSRRGTDTRMHLEQWFDRKSVQPRIVGEFDDSALMNVFGQRGRGAFVAPTAIENEVTAQLGVEVVGRTDELKQRFFAISVERRLRHPAVVAIAASARTEMFT